MIAGIGIGIGVAGPAHLAFPARVRLYTTAQLAWATKPPTRAP
jgi:hypothetical protein